jgi:hypothetical protein
MHLIIEVQIKKQVVNVVIIPPIVESEGDLKSHCPFSYHLIFHYFHFQKPDSKNYIYGRGLKITVHTQGKALTDLRRP